MKLALSMKDSKVYKVWKSGKIGGSPEIELYETVRK